jgi:hypothetical protein
VQIYLRIAASKGARSISDSAYPTDKLHCSNNPTINFGRKGPNTGIFFYSRHSTQYIYSRYRESRNQLTVSNKFIENKNTPKAQQIKTCVESQRNNILFWTKPDSIDILMVWLTAEIAEGSKWDL